MGLPIIIGWRRSLLRYNAGEARCRGSVMRPQLFTIGQTLRKLMTALGRYSEEDIEVATAAIQ